MDEGKVEMTPLEICMGMRGKYFEGKEEAWCANMALYSKSLSELTDAEYGAFEMSILEAERRWAKQLIARGEAMLKLCDRDQAYRAKCKAALEKAEGTSPSTQNE